MQKNMFSFRIDLGLKEKLEILAKKEDRTLSNFINFILRKEVEKRKDELNI